MLNITSIIQVKFYRTIMVVIIKYKYIFTLYL
jgi:hypothetical protein